MGLVVCGVDSKLPGAMTKSQLDFFPAKILPVVVPQEAALLPHLIGVPSSGCMKAEAPLGAQALKKGT